MHKNYLKMNDAGQRVVLPRIDPLYIHVIYSSTWRGMEQLYFVKKTFLFVYYYFVCCLSFLVTRHPYFKWPGVNPLTSW